MLQQWRRQQYLQRAGARAMMSPVSQKHPIIWNVFVILGLTGSSAGKESACNAGDPGLILGTGRSAGEGISYALQYSWASLVAQLVESACNVGDLGLIPRLGRSPGEGKYSPLQYSGPENSVDCIVRGVTKSRTWLTDFHFTGGPVVGTWCFHYCGLDSIPGWGTKILQVIWHG